MNSSNGSQGEPPASYNSLQTMALTILYCITMLVAFLGNILLIFVVKRKPDTRTLTGFLFANMAVADLLVSFIVMPVSIQWVYTFGLKWLPGILGHVTCIFVHYIFHVTIAASIISLSLISVDRYFAVVFPLRRFPRFRQAKVLTVFLWLSSMFFSIPAAVTWRFEKNEKLGRFICAPNFEKLGQFGMKGFYLYLFLLMYLIPLLMISSLYLLTGRALWLQNLPERQFTNQSQHGSERTKRKVIRTLVIITAVFALCWLPTQCYHLILAFRPDIHDTSPLFVMSLCFWLGHANSAINPWLYMVLGDNFRKALCEVLHGGGYPRYGSRYNGAQCSSRYSAVVQNYSVRAIRGLLYQEREDVCRETVL